MANLAREMPLIATAKARAISALIPPFAKPWMRKRALCLRQARRLLPGTAFVKENHHGSHLPARNKMKPATATTIFRHWAPVHALLFMGVYAYIKVRHELWAGLLGSSPEVAYAAFHTVFMLGILSPVGHLLVLIEHEMVFAERSSRFIFKFCCLLIAPVVGGIVLFELVTWITILASGYVSCPQEALEYFYYKNPLHCFIAID